MSDKPKMAPVQGYSAGIPWAMHLRAYDAYRKKYSPQPEMINYEKGCRGGFGVSELDMFIPGWREELSELSRLRAANEKLAEALRECSDSAGAPENIDWELVRDALREHEANKVTE